ncbi:hypothetical protein SAMN05444162_1528 [Paenibacillaceae bacterium GAS479]|nr:hypothetical protein SAMN05444162_1528 [Paenibacillaceae bacterium GAS479]
MKRIRLILMAILALFAIYVYMDWEMIKLKSGLTEPTFISYEQYGEKQIKIPVPQRSFEQVNVTISDLYYMPKSHQITLALWFPRWAHRGDDIPNRIFDIKFEDSQGRVYENSWYAQTKEGVLDVAYYRATDDIDLTGVTKLKMTITSVKQVDDTVTPLKSEEIMIDIPAVLN